jgi:hypothetical protein
MCIAPTTKEGDMKMTGITCFYRNGNERHKNFIIFILCGLDEEQAVVEGEWPGVMIEPGYKWPFIINVGFSSTMRFANQEICNTTFGLRKILPDESFSVDPDWIYEVQTCRQYLDSDGTSSEQHVVKLAKVTAACTNKNTSHIFVLWCGVNSMGEVQSGKWMGYCVDDGVTTPIVVAIGSGPIPKLTMVKITENQ